MKSVFIVEGVNDADQIHKAFKNLSSVTTLVTEGTKLSGRIRNEIESFLKKGINIYILSDPDEAGEQLAEMIRLRYPEIIRIEVDKTKCAYYTGKRLKAGIEYASYSYLKKILCPYLGLEFIEEESPICWD